MTSTPTGVLARSRPALSVLDLDPDGVRAFLRERLGGGRVEEAYLFGSFAEGSAELWSDLDLVIVAATEAPFVERPRAFWDLLDLGVPIDILVYTAEEFAALRASGTGFWREFERTKVRIV